MDRRMDGRTNGRTAERRRDDHKTSSHQDNSTYSLQLSTVWVKKSSPPKTFCDIFTCDEPVYLKITVAIAQTYLYVYTNFGPFI